VNNRIPQKLGFLGLLLLLSSTIANAQQPPQVLVAQVKKAVVLINTTDSQGNALFQGSGFFIAADRVVTNLHVVGSAAGIRIQTANGENIFADSIIAKDEKADLAIVKLNGPVAGVTTLEVDSLGALEGDNVFVVSNPRGSRWKVTVGKVGASWNFEDVGSRMQITASIEPGSSGGPVVNLRGHVVGVATMHIQGGGTIDLAVPSERLTSLRSQN
jgi:S1-C subfamily serine protease